MRGYNEEELRKVILESGSLREVLKKFGRVAAGGNYYVLKRAIMMFNIDISHFSEARKIKQKRGSSPQIPLKDILIENSTYGNAVKLKKRLIAEGMLEYRCYFCGITEWQGKPITLEIEHKNGDKFDNRIENLSILCPNCHSQTPTFRGRNKSKNYKEKEKNRQEAVDSRKKPAKRIEIVTKKRNRIITIKICQDCGKRLCDSAITYRCEKCNAISKRKAVRPPLDELLKMVDELGYCATGRKCGVTDNAIRKWIRTYKKELN
jgi:Zn finger protein HypA/HybF involved in hydrogenase expression